MVHTPSGTDATTCGVRPLRISMGHFFFYLVPEGILDTGMHNKAKLILLLCCMRLPRSRARDGLYVVCGDVDMATIDTDTLAFWLAF